MAECIHSSGAGTDLADSGMTEPGDLSRDPTANRLRRSMGEHRSFGMVATVYQRWL